MNRNPTALHKPFLHTVIPGQLRIQVGGVVEWEPGEETEGFHTSIDDALRMVTQHRALGCASYGTCLEDAALAQWPGWTCKRCSVFKL